MSPDPKSADEILSSVERFCQKQRVDEAGAEDTIRLADLGGNAGPLGAVALARSAAAPVFWEGNIRE
jgi:hypothetical protein